ncbi:Uncharacterised protein [Mycobacteroides abscessus subsp. abscessus]|nr:Uncharacterised protein [Mycobacteroides abscessus subsp. abscessus]
MPAPANAPETPSTSVLSACQPSPERTSVLAAPIERARSVAVDANRNAANLPGMVTEKPTHSGPAPPTTSGSCSAVHSIRSYVHPVRPSSR